MQAKTNCFVVIPSSSKNGTGADKLSVHQMLNDGKAIGFRGTVERVKAQRFLVVVDKDNKKAYYADILRVTHHHKPESKVPRVDVKFGIVRQYGWEDLMELIQVESGQANTRYVWLTGFHRF
jgi:hypothetical protein